ncbi:AraC family transcriptional regulator [Thalassomonas haliotis]|uniref:AraC family transcriptional regulator n=1 Tax=Thalassomonas haliotis TaxID=485448 RepID=A0ABY7VM28_9GAMM|nr:AraC family transcriptional regulator [Thalassomonas haliotis]WDE13988.1 AraC family transcriptional regulator [Thalassomonas haliotis]
MITEKCKANPQVLIENKITFAGPQSELSIYDTYEAATRVPLKSDQLLFCAMVSGKKVMHGEDGAFQRPFLPHESFVMAPDSPVEIDFPGARLDRPTRCLAIEISKERINEIAAHLDKTCPKARAMEPWQYRDKLLHLHHNSQTQALLDRMLGIYSENHPDRSYMINLAVSELTIRLLREQSRELLLSFASNEPDFNGINAVLQHITSHLHEELDIDALSRIACMSRSKFFSEFKNHLGCSPLAFQQQTRIRQAANLIKSGKQITKVCFELGFGNASHFSRRFKQYFGLSPRQYRSRHIKL